MTVTMNLWDATYGLEFILIYDIDIILLMEYTLLIKLEPFFFVRNRLLVGYSTTRHATGGLHG
jgi:hypothetical protein